MKFGINRVKIRILSGGKEHSTLESLRESFSLEDVLPSYNDGRLATWLRQRDEDDIADKLVKLKQEEKQPEALALALINIFFNGEKGEEFNSVLDFANYCMQNGQKLTADHAYDYVIQQNDENKQIELAKNGALTLEKALKNGISGKTMYIICRNLLNAAEKDDAKKNIAYQWFYEAEKCNDEETVEFKKTGDYQIICNEVPLQTKTITFNDQEYVDLGLSVYWAKNHTEFINRNNFFPLVYELTYSSGHFRPPTPTEAEELIGIPHYLKIVEMEGIRVGDKTDSIFLPFFKGKKYGSIWLSNKNVLSYDDNGLIYKTHDTTYDGGAFVLYIHSKSNGNNTTCFSQKNDSEVKMLYKKIKDKCVDLNVSVLWSKRKYDILQSQTETMPPIKWEGGCWAYPNKYQLEELSQQGSFHYFSKTENCRGVLIKDCLFLPFLDNSHNYGFIIGEGDYCLYYDNSGTMKIVEKSKYAPAFIFPVLTKLS